MDASSVSSREDRLSELPDSLILEILSLLEMEDAVRTTILSKRWKDLWITVPNLDFGSESCPSFIERALAKWKGTKILNCRMDFWDDYPSSSDILDSWLLLLIEKQVEGLYLDVGNQMDVYSLPQRLYSCSSLADLFLGYCDFEIEQSVQWYKLKTLMIEYPYPYSLSDDTLNQILSGAPLLEMLVLSSLDLFESFNIRSTSLKIIEISSRNGSCARTLLKATLRISAPNLLGLEISACVFGTCLLDVPSLTNVTLRFEDSCHVRSLYMIEEEFPPIEMFDKMFRSISHAETITLSSWCIQYLLNIKEEFNMIKFPNTKILMLYPGSAKEMLDVLEMFPQLMMLGVEPHQDYYEYFKSEKSEVDVFQSLTSKATFPCTFLHQLKTVEICWCACDASILSAIEILLQNARLLDKMEFRPKWSHGHRCNRKLWLKAKGKVKSMSRSSPTAKVVVRMTSLEGIRI